MAQPQGWEPKKKEKKKAAASWGCPRAEPPGGGWVRSKPGFGVPEKDEPAPAAVLRGRFVCLRCSPRIS